MKIVQTTTSQKYVLNGKEYNSLEEMPEAERNLFIAAQRAMESAGPDSPVRVHEAVIGTFNGRTKYVVNGREYHSLEEVPEAERHLIEEAGLSLKPAGSGEPLKAEGVIVEEKKFRFGSDAAGSSPTRLTFSINLGTVLWVLIGLAVVIVAVSLIMKGMGR